MVVAALAEGEMRRRLQEYATWRLLANSGRRTWEYDTVVHLVVGDYRTNHRPYKKTNYFDMPLV